MASQVQPRHHTPGGWRRVLFGLLVGVGFSSGTFIDQAIEKVQTVERGILIGAAWLGRGHARHGAEGVR